MLLATRCLTYLIEANPKFSKSIVTHFAIPIFCEKLLSIQYIDVAEQCIQALEKLSIEHSVDVLKSDGLVALLSYLEFFSVSVQRSCVDTASNLCRNVPEDLFHNVSSVLPLLSNLLLNSDPKSQYTFFPFSFFPPFPPSYFYFFYFSLLCTIHNPLSTIYHLLSYFLFLDLS